MDANSLYFEHQIALMRVADASCSVARTGYQAVADAVARRIRRLQLAAGAAAAEGWLPGRRPGA